MLSRLIRQSPTRVTRKVFAHSVRIHRNLTIKILKVSRYNTKVNKTRKKGCKEQNVKIYGIRINNKV